MRTKFISALLVITFCQCNHNSNYNPEIYLSNQAVKDSVLADIISYVIPKPESSSYYKSSETLRKYYVERLSFFGLINFYKANDSTFYFVVTKKVASIKNEIVGIGGYYVVKNNKIQKFVEVFNTPKMSHDQLKNKSELLLEELIQKGNINKYITNRTLVEFPDDRTFYDVQSNSWKVKVN